MLSIRCAGCRFRIVVATCNSPLSTLQQGSIDRSLSADASAACILPLLSQMHLDLQALKTAQAALGRLKTQVPGHPAAAAVVMKTQTASQC